MDSASTPAVAGSTASSDACPVTQSQNPPRRSDWDSSWTRGDWDDPYQAGQSGFPRGEHFGEFKLVTFLADGGTQRAKVEYEDEPGKTKFEVEVFGGQPGAVLDVAVNGTVVGAVTLNQFGRGKLEFHSFPHEFHHQPFPPNFPALQPGDTVSVGQMSGTLY